MRQVWVIAMQAEDDVNNQGFITVQRTEDGPRELHVFDTESHAERFLRKNVDDLPSGWLFIPQRALLKD